MRKRILLLTKDALCKEYLPQYGNLYWKGKTPNIDELVSKGTIFEHFYTAAPSTVMAFRSMMFGKFAHETPYSDYIPLTLPEEESDFYNIAKRLGYTFHIIWDEAWVRMVLRYGNCYGKDTTIHNIPELRQGVGVHYKHTEPLKQDDNKSEKAINDLEQVVKGICEADANPFVWIHLPHVINGRTGYGGDIDLFDRCIGMLRKYFSDDAIYIAADHGNMDGHFGKYTYGFDVNTTAIEIPLITPRIQGQSTCTEYVSNVDLHSIVFEGIIPRREFLFSDCAYYAQPHRKLAIIHNEFAYIYNKLTRTEELYDLRYDRLERCNMMTDTVYDVDRKLQTITKEVFFSPRWEEAEKERDIMRHKKDEIWRTPPLWVEVRGRIISTAKKQIVKVRKLILGR